MKHTVITIDIDIATAGEFYYGDQCRLLEQIDQALESAPVEFEDWKVTVKQEEREL